MRLVFIYVQDGAAAPGSNTPWNPKALTQNRYTSKRGLRTEGTFWLLRRMLRTGIVDEILVVVESVRSPGSTVVDGIKILVMPEIMFLGDFLKPDDVIWVRGGFRTWHPFLELIHEEKKWLLIYAANTGRERWLFWDVVFNDLRGAEFIDGRGRLNLFYKKPTHPEIFYPMKRKRTFDVCVGASYIHDKKGQWRIMGIARAYREIFGSDLKCLLPGALRKGTRTNLMIKDLMNTDLDITFVSMLPRVDLAEQMNRCRVFIHLGASGQNDRGPLEAMRCGCPVMLSNPKYHSPLIYDNQEVCKVFTDHNDSETTAREIHDWVEEAIPSRRDEVFNYYESTMGVETVILPQMKNLFDFFREVPMADREKLHQRWEETGF